MAVNTDALRKMTTLDLRELNGAIVAEINERNRNRQRDLVRQFRTGRMVNVRVDRFNTKTIGCTELNSDGSLTMKTWRGSPGLLVSIAA